MGADQNVSITFALMLRQAQRDEPRKSSILPRNRHRQERCLVREEKSLEREEIVRAGGDEIEKIGFISVVAIGRRWFGAAVWMRVKTADDASLAAAQFPQKRELDFRIDQETARRIAGDIGRFVYCERAPAVGRVDAFDEAARFVRIGARGGLQHGGGQFVGEMKNARGHLLSLT